MELEKEQTTDSDRQGTILDIQSWGVPPALTGSRILSVCLKKAPADGSISQEVLYEGIHEAAVILKLTPERAQRELRRVLMKALRQASLEAKIQETLIHWLYLI